MLNHSILLYCSSSPSPTMHEDWPDWPFGQSRHLTTTIPIKDLKGRQTSSIKKLYQNWVSDFFLFFKWWILTVGWIRTKTLYSFLRYACHQWSRYYAGINGVDGTLVPTNESMAPRRQWSRWRAAINEIDGTRGHTIEAMAPRRRWSRWLASLIRFDVLNEDEDVRVLKNKCQEIVSCEWMIPLGVMMTIRKS